MSCKARQLTGLCHCHQCEYVGSGFTCVELRCSPLSNKWACEASGSCKETYCKFNDILTVIEILRQKDN